MATDSPEHSAGRLYRTPSRRCNLDALPDDGNMTDTFSPDMTPQTLAKPSLPAVRLATDATRVVVCPVTPDRQLVRIVHKDRKDRVVLAEWECATTVLTPLLLEAITLVAASMVPPLTTGANASTELRLI